MKKIFTLLTSLLLVTAITLPSQLSAQSCPWAKKAGGKDEDQGTAVATDANGNVYYLGNFYSASITLTGTTTFSVTLQNQPQLAFNWGSEMYLAKYDSCGVLKWAKRAGGRDDTYGSGLATDAAGNVYVTGYCSSDTTFFGVDTLFLTGGSYKSSFLVKYDGSNGAVLWGKSGTGNYKDEGNAVAVGIANDVYITGIFSSTSITFGSNTITNGTNDSYTYDAYIAKFDAITGSSLWIRGNTSSSSTSGHTLPFGIGVDASGGVYAGGRFYSNSLTFGGTSLANTNSSYSDIFIVKYDGTGNFLWLKAAGSSSDDGIYGLAADAAGNSYITGFIGNGTTTFGSGVSLSSATANRAIFIAKYATNGTALWAKTAVGNHWSDNFGTGISIDAGGNAYITGTYSSDALTIGTLTLTNVSSGGSNPDFYYDIFVAKYKTNGILSWARTAGGDSTDIGNGIASGPNGALYITGTFNSPTLAFAGVPTLSLTTGSFVGNYNPSYTDNDAFISNNIAAINMAPDICLVSADSIVGSNEYNVVYWDKTPYPNAASFIIYREVSTGIYKRIGSQPYSTLSEFVDTVRSVGPANGDPKTGFYKYAMQIMDTAGTYSLLSPYHQTVFFVDNHTGAFTWNIYAVGNSTYTPVGNYYLMRDNNNTGVWTQIGSVAGSATTLNDPSYVTYSVTANWRVDGDGFNCTPTFRMGNNSNLSAIIKSKSNITNNRGGIGVNQINASSVLNVYPNPSKGSFVIETVSAEKQNIQVVDVNGKIVLSTTITGTTTVDASNLADGVYTINIVNKNNVANKRLVIVK